MGCQIVPRGPIEFRVLVEVSFRGIQRANEGKELRIAYQKMGASAGGSILAFDQKVPESLWMEFDAREPQPRGTHHRVAHGR